MQRPVFLYERLTVPARKQIDPIIPGQVRTTAEVLKSPERMKIDYIFMNQLGFEATGIVRPKDIGVIISDMDRTAWNRNPVPLENYNNMIRTLLTANMWGPQQIIIIESGPAGVYVIPAGKWMMVASDPGLLLQMQTALAWVGIDPPGGVVHSDGVNVRVANTTEEPHGIVLRRVDMNGFGEWWPRKPFRLEKGHSVNLNVLNLMAQKTNFYISFEALGEETGRVYHLDQPISLGAGVRRVFNGLGMNVTLEEPILIKQMAYGREYFADADPETGEPVINQFDPEYVELQIKPSQGSEWSEYEIPLLAYSNIRGDFASCFHRPLERNLENLERHLTNVGDEKEKAEMLQKMKRREGVILEQNDFLNFDLYNYSAEEREVQVVMAGYVI